MDFLDLMRNRYTCKHYDPEREVSDEDYQKILEALRLTPSAVNVQAWSFYSIEGQEARARFARCVSEANMDRYQKCSRILVLAARVRLGEADFKARIDASERCGRYQSAAARDEELAHLAGYTSRFAQSEERMETWAGKQVYIALATALYAAASLGVDSTPVEGFDRDAADRILGLAQKGERAEVCVFLGYRKDDTNDPAVRPKGRLGLDAVLTRL